MTDDSADLVVRRRRAAYRAAHRGTKEMDILLSRFADARLPEMGDADLTRFEQLLALPDPELQKWILEPVPAAAWTGHDLADLVFAVRRFHGLPAPA